MSPTVQDAAFDALPLQLAVIDGQGVIVAANPALRTYVAARGGRADGILGQPYLEACGGALGLDPRAPALAALLEGRMASVELRQDGGARWLLLTAIPLRTEAGGHRLLIHAEAAERSDDAALRRAVIENSTDLTVVLRRDATIAFVSPSVHELLGHAPERVIGRPGFELLHPDDLAQAADAFARGIASPGSKTPLLTLRMLHADGSWRPFDIQGRSLTADVMGGSILISARDASARVKAEAEAAHAHVLLQSVFDNSPLGLLLCGADDRIVLANRAFKESYSTLSSYLEPGRSFEALVRAVAESRQIATLATPVDIELFIAQRMVAHQVADGTPVIRQLDDGRRVQIFEKRLPGGETLSVGVDVSAIIEATEAAAASEARLRSILENIAEMVITMDGNGRVLSFNRAAEQAFGYPEREIVGKHAAFLAEGRDLSRFVGAGPREIRALRRSGEGFTIALAVSEAHIAGQRIFIASMRDVDERRRLTRALEESELRFRVTFDQAPIGMSLAAPDATLLRVNRALCDFLGYTEDELLKRKYSDLTEPEDLAAQRADIKRLRDGDIPVIRMEKRYRRKDGTLAWGDLTTSCVRKADGTPDYYISIIQDIRQRKSAEDAVRQREEQLRLIADNVPMIIIYYDHELRYRFANRTTAEWYGIPLDRIVGRKVADVLPPETFARLQPHILETLAGKQVRFSDQVRYPDGRLRQVEFIYQPHVGDDGSVIGAIVVVSDIGERLDMVQVLQRRERELSTIAEHFPGLIGYCDADLQLRFINQTGASWYGRRAEDLIGHPVEDFLPSEHWEPYKRLLEHVLEGNSVHREMSFTYPDGTVRLVDLMHMPDRADDGSIRGVFTFVFDLTERRQVEEQLRQVQKMEAVGQLTGGIAHDFNNLLGVIVGNLDLLTRQLENDPRSRAWAQRAIAAAERGAALTQRLLAFSRRQALRPQPVDAGRLIDESAVLLQRTLGEAISVVTHRGEGLWSCMVDAPQLESALLNLAINARDAMPQGGRISIEATNAVLDEDYAARNREVAPGEYVCISVSDTGTGMSPEVMARAFDPFFTTKPVGKGTGLGLSMVYGFVKQSGGHVRIYSEPGHGTAVRLFLPRTPQDRGTAAPSGDGSSPLPMGDGELVLVVEDNPAMLEFAVNALDTLGYRVLAARDASEAERLLTERGDIELLFSDVILPGGSSGFALAGRARQRRADLPILLMSGFSERNIKDEGNPDIERIEILPKPYRIRDLGLKLRTVLHRRSG